MTSSLTLARVSELCIIILKPPYGRAEICSTYLTRSWDAGSPFLITSIRVPTGNKWHPLDREESLQKVLLRAVQSGSGKRIAIRKQLRDGNSGKTWPALYQKEDWKIHWRNLALGGKGESKKERGQARLWAHQLCPGQKLSEQLLRRKVMGPTVNNSARPE